MLDFGNYEVNDCNILFYRFYLFIFNSMLKARDTTIIDTTQHRQKYIQYLLLKFKIKYYVTFEKGGRRLIKNVTG